MFFFKRRKAKNWYDPDELGRRVLRYSDGSIRYESSSVGQAFVFGYGLTFLEHRPVTVYQEFHNIFWYSLGQDNPALILEKKLAPMCTISTP